MKNTVSTVETEKIEFDELLKGDIYAQTYGKLFTDKIEHLREIILNGTTMPDEFNVFALESGLGKSKYTNKIIDESLNVWGKSRNFLVVKRFKADVEEMEESLNYHNSSESISAPTVLGITGDNWSKWREQIETLQKIKVIIITHKRYIDLCLNDELRSAFTLTRDVLIIDEKVNFPTYSFSEKSYSNIRPLLRSRRIEELFDKVCVKLRNELEKREIAGEVNKCVRVEFKIHPATLNKFLEQMELNLKDYKDIKNRNIIQEFLDGLVLWFSGMCIYNGGNIITFDRRHKLWGLKNNIILDASSAIDGVYQLSEHYNVVGENRIVDHSQSSFNIIHFNTSKSNLINNQKDYYKELAAKIKANHSDDEQTLIICHKVDFPKIENELLRLGITDIHIANEPIKNAENVIDEEIIKNPYAINWFGNVIGKNAYADFSNCWIIATPNIPIGQYLMQYMMYTGDKNLGNMSLDIKKGKFKNYYFNKVQSGYVASEIYQALKRTQRTTKPYGKFFIVNSDSNIVELVLSQIEGSGNRTEMQLDFAIKNKKNEGSNHVDKFISYMKNVSVGQYRKKDVCERLNIKHLYRVLKVDRVKAMEEHGYIKIGRLSIEKLLDWDKDLDE